MYFAHFRRACRGGVPGKFIATVTCVVTMHRMNLPWGYPAFYANCAVVVLCENL